MNILSRQDAIKQGRTLYFTGRPCKHGHLAPRYVVTGACAECAKAYQRKRQSAAKRGINAAQQGLTNFQYPLHADDVAAALAYCQALDMQRGRTPHTPASQEPADFSHLPHYGARGPILPKPVLPPADFSHLPHYGARGPILPKPVLPPAVSMPWDKGELR